MQKVKECRTCALHKRNNKRLFEELEGDQGRLLQEGLCREQPLGGMDTAGEGKHAVIEEVSGHADNFTFPGSGDVNSVDVRHDIACCLACRPPE